MLVAIARWWLKLFGKLDLVEVELDGDDTHAWISLTKPSASLRANHPILPFLKKLEPDGANCYRLTGSQVWEFKRRWVRRGVRYEGRDKTDWREVAAPALALDVGLNGTTATVEFKDAKITAARDGWFRRRSEWWTLKVDDEPFIVRQATYGPERLRKLFAELVPAWRAARIDVRGETLAVANQAPLQVDVQETERGDVTVRAAWTQPVTPLKGDEGWAFAGHSIVPLPKLTPTVRKALDSGPVTLDCEKAAEFLRDERKDPRVLDQPAVVVTVRGDKEDFLLEAGLVWGETWALESELRAAGRRYIRKNGNWCRIDLKLLDDARANLVAKLRKEYLDPIEGGAPVRLRDDDVAEFRASAGDWFKGWRIIYQKSASDAHVIARGPTRPILKCVRATEGGLGYVGLQVELDLAGARVPLKEVAPVLDLGTRWLRRDKTWLEVDRRIVQRLVEGVPAAWRSRLDRPLPIDAHRLDEMLEAWKPYGEVKVDPEIGKLREFLAHPSLPPRWPKSFTTTSPGGMRLFSWIGACGDFGISPTLLATVDRDLMAAIAALAATYREAGGAGPILVIARSKRLPAWAEGLRLLAPLEILNLSGRRKPPSMDEIRKAHALLAAPNTLETEMFSAIDGEWPVVVFDQIDQTVSTDGSKAFETLSKLRARMRIGCVSEREAFDKNGKMTALAGILYSDAAAKLLYEADSKEERANQLATIQSFISPFSYDPQANVKLFAARPAPSREFTSMKFATAVRRRDVTARVELGAMSAWDDFVKAAQKERSNNGLLSGRVAFQSHQPTYANLSAAQRQWYFYWRSQFRAGKPLETDASYLYLHAYELLNLVEEPDPRLAINRLAVLWRTYRQAYPKLDALFIDWIADLYFLHVGTEAGLAWEWKHQDFGRPFRELDLLLEMYVAKGEVEKIPVGLWRRLSGYRPSNRFYAEHAAEVDQAHQQGLVAADCYWRRTAKQSVFDHFVPERSIRMRRTLFEDAVVGSARPREIVIGRARPYSRQPALAAQLAAVAKQAENALRKKLAFASKIKGYELDPALAAEIDAVFGIATKAAPALSEGRKARVEGAPAPVEIKLTLDTRLVEQLQKESDAVREILAGPDDAPVSAPAEEKETVAPVKAADGRMLYTSLPEMRRLWRDLDFIQRQTVTDIFHGSVKNLKTLEVQLRSAGQMPLTVLDRINERASAELGDLLVAVERESLSITEDFTDELEVVVDGKVVSAASPSDGYGALVSQLDAAERTLLTALAREGPMASSKVDELLRPTGLMSSLAIDRINEKANSTVGDLVLVTDGASIKIEDEYAPALKSRLEN